MAQIHRRTTNAGEARYDVRTRIGGRVVTRTFKRKRDAESYATSIEADRLRGVAIDPRRSKVTLGEYARQYLDGRGDLAERTRDKYNYLLTHHIIPPLGSKPIGGITPSDIRQWHTELYRRMPPTSAGAYRLLSQIMRAAMADEVIVRNPCQVRGAATERAPERPVATVTEVAELASLMPDETRIAVLLAAWCQLRRGEVLGLRRRDVDLLHRTVTVAVTRAPSMSGLEIIKPPKPAAGKRTLVVPAHVLGELEAHLDEHTEASADAWLVPCSARTLERHWQHARKAAGLPGLRFHDLRHTGLTHAAATGATTAELMHRAGHASPLAALRYQHATQDRDRALAEALSELAGESADVARDGRAMRARSAQADEERLAEKPLLTSDVTEQSQRGSNPCLHLERVVS